MEASIYNQEGKSAGKVSLPENIFGLPWNADLVHQVVVSMQSSMRHPIAHAKMRGEVRGGGKKPWKQKGTGRARHGSSRSPIWVGGGTTHGPRNEKNFLRKINKKMKDKAIALILSAKLRDNELLFVDSLSFKAPKTADAKKVIGAFAAVKGFEKLSSKKNNAAYIAIPAKNKAVEKSFSNFSNMTVDELRNMSPLDVMNAKYVVIVDAKNSVEALKTRFSK
jgi:large subunit ribosomal protein L4